MNKEFYLYRPDYLVGAAMVREEASKVDVSTLQVGDIVQHRNGGKSEVARVEDTGGGENAFRYKVWFKGQTSLGFDGSSCREPDHIYQKPGTHYGTANKMPFDIVEIFKKPFDWSDAKPGMAFIKPNGSRWYYVAQDPSSSLHVILCTTNNKYVVGLGGDMTFFTKKYLKRDPAADRLI